MAYRFVQAYHDLGLRKGPIRGFLTHMAEGGGTVEYLSKWNPNGVSVHYVIRYTGEIVQMLREDHMHSSIRANSIRTTNDPDGFYGAKTAKAVLGDWATIETTLGPNHATIAVECEGFAATGPNVTQKVALQRLAADVRNRHFVNGNLGHRDFQDYKACPGKLIPWTLLGGHGVFGEEPPKEEPMQGFNVPEVPMRATLKENPDRPGNSAWMYTTSALVADGQEVSLKPIRPLPLVGYVSAAVHILAYEPSAGDTNTVSRAMYVRATDIAKTEKVPEPEPIPVDCTQAIEDAIATDRLKAHVAWRE